MRRADIVVYVSSHGFGHSVREAELLRALLRLEPRLAIEVRTRAPRWIFPPEVRMVERSLDVGVVQPESFRIEPRETLARYAALIDSEGPLLDAEAAELRAAGVRLVVGDVPSAAFEVAARAGVPGVGVANFSWDWIYQPFVGDAPEHGPVLEHLRAQYGRADLLLRLPFHGDLSCFPRIQDVPLIARRGSPDRIETRRRLGLPLDAPLVLLSFGGFRFDGLDADRLATLPYAFIATELGAGAELARGFGAEAGPAAGTSVRALRSRNLFLLPEHGYSYVDLLAACDSVVTKLGYGIVSDCLANRVPLLYVPRGQFREEPVLAEAVERLGRAVLLSRDALLRWDLGPSLEHLLSLDRPWADLPLDGADVAARELLDLTSTPFPRREGG